jgi:protein tyrosine phosphatase (PTP) superfamily phosphohydrolase (DUF442 family)
MKKASGWLLLAILALTSAGCRNPQRRPALQSQPVAPPSPRPVLPANPPPATPGQIQQAPYVPPPGANVPPPTPPSGSFPTVPPTPPPTAPPPGPSGALQPPNQPIAQVENRWQPAENGARLGAPEPIAGEAPKVTPRLYPPDKTPDPPSVKNSIAPPVGIPQFASAMANVETGLRPSLDEGLDWLRSRGYRTVVHIRLPGENDTADRKQVEKRGMKYLSLEVSPQTLIKATVDEFNRIVRDTSSQPVFVYDRDGSLAGALWYLYFRIVEQSPEETALIRARSLGLREEREGAHRDMWQAAQKFKE